MALRMKCPVTQPLLYPLSCPWCPCCLLFPPTSCYFWPPSLCSYCFPYTTPLSNPLISFRTQCQRHARAAAALGWWGASPCAHFLCFVPSMLYCCDLLAGLLPLNWPLFPTAGTVCIPACSTALGTHRSSRYLWGMGFNETPF